MNNGIAPLGGLQASDPVVPAGPGSGIKSSGALFAAAESPASSSPMHPNPAFHIDAALGLVVMEFRNGPGGVPASIPTSQQLDAYRRAAGSREAAAADGAAAGVPGAHATAAAGSAPSGHAPSGSDSANAVGSAPAGLSDAAGAAGFTAAFKTAGGALPA